MVKYIKNKHGRVVEVSEADYKRLIKIPGNSTASPPERKTVSSDETDPDLDPKKPDPAKGSTDSDDSKKTSAKK